MIFGITLTLALGTGVLAAPRAVAPSQEVRAVFSYAKASSTTLVKVFNADKSEFYGESDGSSIESGNFAKFPITFDVDEIGFGSIAFGNSSYLTRSNREESGGAICHRKFNADTAEVDCWLPIPDGFSPEAVDQADKRQLIYTGVQCAPISTTYVIGDGDPHQNYYHKQLSESIECRDAPSCSAGFEQSESFTIGFSASASIAGWITGGFDVQQSWETGRAYNCYGAKGDTVCVWYNTAHTAITVKNLLTLQIPCTNPVRQYVSDPVILKSPNARNRGGGYYCVIGACRSIGDDYWDNTGPAGGPQ
ncbi:hypothetical protein G7Z17_g1937 [Cylindrodendrum hubeiense]|uniref:Uncharacterized protein n=1 Tax=Cylindrodendrum hubeiense TaxID=595255 RepID=A0A9P5HK00_9HYPO|nr:hypothetical protein G7Z17_g1937 [Cylindrodendrum hubeiense]